MIVREHDTAESVAREATRWRIPSDDNTELIVLSLYTASVALIGVGVMTHVPAAWLAGGAAFVATFMVDRHRREPSR